MEKYAKLGMKPRSWKDAELRLKKVLPYLSQRKLSSITKQDMREVHNQIGQENSKYEANSVLEYIRAIFNKMISWGWEGTNPAIGVKKFREIKRDRFILKDELPKFLEALENEPNKNTRNFSLHAYTQEPVNPTFYPCIREDIDFSISEWRIADTKNSEPVRVPLLDEALEILNSRMHLRESSPWTFPSNDSKSGHIQEPKTAWKRILERAGLENLRIHDLRRTLASYQATTGSSLTIIGKSLGHKSLQSTAIYARLSNDPARAELERAFSFT
jgi:integrase